MNMFITLRRVALLLSGLVVLGLSACASKKPPTPTPVSHTRHTITIKYDAAAHPQWDYDIYPPQSDPKNARVKRHDIVEWKCAQGSWMVYFKGPTPLVDKTGKELYYVNGVAGNVAVGGEVSSHLQKDEYEYGVSVVLTGTGEKVNDDPRIFIEN
jgi:hypothetical protein